MSAGGWGTAGRRAADVADKGEDGGALEVSAGGQGGRAAVRTSRRTGRPAEASAGGPGIARRQAAGKTDAGEDG